MVTVLNLTNGSHAMDFPKKRTTFPSKEQDPMSHRIIEKRRRDRMNNCLADLSRLIPPDYLKKGRGRIEKTEIIEMAIKHLKYLQERANCVDKRENCPISTEHFRLGYQECLSEVMRYLVEGQGHFPREPVCVQLINHLQRHCDNIMKGDVLNTPRCNLDSNSSSSGSSNNYAIHNQSSVPNNIRLKGKQMDVNSNDRHHQHSNTYSEEISAISNNDLEHFRLSTERADELPEKSMGDAQEMFTEQTLSPTVNTNGFSGLELVEGNVDEGGGRARADFTRNALPQVPNNIETDCQSAQDLRLPNQFSPKYYCHRGQFTPNSRTVRKGDASQQGDSGVSSGQGDTDNIHSYKFKNTIKQRFSQSQSMDYSSSSPSEGTTANTFNSNEHSFICRDQYIANGKFSHKKRKNNNDHQSRHTNYENNQYKDQTSSSETNSSENITSVSQNSNYRSKKLPEIETSVRASTDGDYLKLGQHLVPNIRHSKLYGHTDNIEDTFSKFPGVGVPIFALHAKGSFYVPMNVDYDCLVPFLGPYDLLDATALQPNISLHPVTISVNFQPLCFANKPVPVRTKSERKDWQ